MKDDLDTFRGLLVGAVLAVAIWTAVVYFTTI